MHKVNLTEKFSLITEHWRPKVVAELNGQEVKLVKVRGEFVWHHHDLEDELFLIVRGSLRIEFRDRVGHAWPGGTARHPPGRGAPPRGGRGSRAHALRAGGHPQHRQRGARDPDRSGRRARLTAPSLERCPGASFPHPCYV